MTKKTRKRKIWKVIVLILSIFVLLIIVLANIPLTKDKTTTIDNTPKDPRLADQNLLYASLNSSGMCSNSKGEEGGCYFRTFLYYSGKYIDESGWEGVNNKKETFPPVEKKLDQESMDKIIKQIKNSNIMKKDCPSVQNEDAWFSYQLNLDGAKKFFPTSPISKCQKIFSEIDTLINSTAKNTN